MSIDGFNPGEPLDLELPELSEKPVAASQPDMREVMARQILGRGHATMDQILHASFGEWPPKGLNIIGANSQRVDFVDLEKFLGTNDPEILAARKAAARGMAQRQGERHIWLDADGISDRNVPGRVGVNSVMGHEAIHILQGDHHQRAAQIFGQTASLDIYSARSTNISDLISDSVFGRHTDQQRYAEIGKLLYEGTDTLDYLRKGIEIQARVHQVMLEGYSTWGQLPQTRTELLVAMQNSGVELSKETIARLEASPGYEDAKRTFKEVPKTTVARDLNLVRSSLTDDGRQVFEQETLTRMYADLIEMYGDKQGRARFGYGPNEFAPLREGVPDTDPKRHKAVYERVPEFTFKPSSRGVDIPVEHLNGSQLIYLQSALDGEKVKYTESVMEDGTKSLSVAREDLQNLAKVRERSLKQNGYAGMQHAEFNALDKSPLSQTDQGKFYLNIEGRTDLEKKLLVQTLEQAGISVTEDKVKGKSALMLEAQDAARISGLKQSLQADAQLATPVRVSPMSSDYHLQTASAKARRELADPSFRPPQKNAQIDIPLDIGHTAPVTAPATAPTAALVDIEIDVAPAKPASAKLDVDLTQPAKIDIDLGQLGKAPSASPVTSTAPVPPAAPVHLDVNLDLGQVDVDLSAPAKKGTRQTATAAAYVPVELIELPASVARTAPPQTAPAQTADAPPARTAGSSAPVANTPARSAAPVEAPARSAPVAVDAPAGKVVSRLGSGVGAAMGIYGLSQKLGADGTAVKDFKDERTAGLAKTGIATDTAAIAADGVELLAKVSKNLNSASKVSRVAAPVGMALSVASGAIDYKIAEKTGDGKRAAAAIGGTTGGMAGAMAGGVAGAKAGAAAGAAIGAFFGGVGAVPGAAIGSAVGGLVGAITGGWIGGEAGKKVAEKTIEKPLQAKFDEEKAARMAAAKLETAKTSPTVQGPAPTQTLAQKPAPATAPTGQASAYRASQNYDAPVTQTASASKVSATPPTQTASYRPIQNYDAPKADSRTERFAASAPDLGKEFTRANAPESTLEPAANEPSIGTRVATGLKTTLIPGA